MRTPFPRRPALNRILPSTRRLALFRLLRQRGLAPGDSMALSELQFAWLRTGLRHNDLSLALRDERDAGRIALDHDHQGVRVVLTDRGAGELRWPSGGVLRWARDALMLRRLGRRRPGTTGGRGGLRQRRLADSRGGVLRHP